MTMNSRLQACTLSLLVLFMTMHLAEAQGDAQRPGVALEPETSMGAPAPRPIAPEPAANTPPSEDAPASAAEVQRSPGSNPLWNAVLSATAALIGAVIGSYSSTRNARASLIQKMNENEIESIEHRLTEFVGPFLHLSEENKILALELKRKQPAGQDFRTLTALLTPGWLEGLSEGDRNLLRAVVANGVELRRLMSEKGGSAVSLELMPYFSKASAHFRFLELAASGSLEMDPVRYNGYVYPRQLDGVLKAEQVRLHARREALRSRPDELHPAMPPLVISNELRLD